MSRSRKASRARSGGASKSPRKAPVAQTTNTDEPTVVTISNTPQQAVSRPLIRRRITLKRVLVSIAVISLLLVLGGVGYAYITIQRTLPTLSGTIKFEGLRAPVTITRDSYGVPHIVAENREDLYAAQGYVHAQDRLFQMFVFRAAGQARLSEAFGHPALNADRFFRTVGFERAAEVELEALKNDAPEVLAGLEAYSRGVNEFIRTHADTLPLEFGLLGVPMEEWRPVDTLTFGKFQAWDLTETWNTELTIADILEKLGPERTGELFPEYGAGDPVIVPGATGGQVRQLIEAYNREVRPWMMNLEKDALGSNNWVVDGTKSATGKPLLANDPHLTVRNPSIWYQVHLATKDGEIDVVGFGFAGGPGVVTGHNREIAWGVTNVGADVQDLYVEKLDDARPGEYQYGDEWLPLDVHTETIKVKAREDEVLTIRSTRHGPIISDALPLTPTIGTSVERPFALQWTGNAPGGVVEALHDLQTASDWGEFRSALSKWSVPGQNFVYADRAGNIGYQMTGVMPVRKQGDGRAPVPGWTGEYNWDGEVSFEDLPSSYNPPEHYIATANNKPFGSEYKQPIYGEWSPTWRIRRIKEMLEAKDKLSIDDFRAMQGDKKSLLAERFAPYIAALKSDDPLVQAAIDRFKDWDANILAESSTAVIYEVFARQTLTETFSDDIGEENFAQYLDVAGSTAFRSIEALLDSPDHPFWDRVETAEKEKRDDILLRSLQQTVADLSTAFGENSEEWSWGKIHTYTAAHPFGSQPLLSGVFNLQSVPLGGDNTTVAVGSYSLPENFTVRNHQSYRMIVDLGDWDNSLAILANGQSGQPFSKHWGDMLAIWQRGDYNPMLYSPDKYGAATGGVLTLTP